MGARNPRTVRLTTGGADMAGVGDGPGLSASVRYVVPWRPDGEYRDRLWAYCKPRWPDVIESGSPPGPFNRAAAINAGAVGEWDVLVVVDADVVIDTARVRAGLERAARTGRVVLPYTTFKGLTPEMTKRVLDGYTGEWSRGIRFQSEVHESSVVIVPRNVWNAVGGFDERFVGWGQEDVAFAHAARMLCGEPDRLEGIVWHLWHPKPPERIAATVEYRANQALGQQYRSARTEQAMRRVLGGRVGQMDVGRQRVFRNIFQRNAWNGDGTRAGPGSSMEATATLRTELPQRLSSMGVRSVLDAACGDSLWQPDLPGYVGIDIVREAVTVAQGAHSDRHYMVADIVSDDLPPADAILCRDVMQHLSFADGLGALKNFRRMGARWLIASTHDGGDNQDIETGGHYRIDLRAAPFDFGEPLWAIPDGMWNGGLQWPGKMLACWELHPAPSTRVGTVATLVPWRGGDELREQSWAVVSPMLKKLGHPVFTGDTEGIWSRAAAINAAAREAGNWNVAIIADADTLFEPAVVKRAVKLAAESAGAIRPHDHLFRLTPSGSIVAARDGVKHLEPRHIDREHPGGGLLVVSREAWDRVGGYDERFIGWGHEDTAFNTALLLKADWDRIEGNAWHLWHPDPERQNMSYRRNRILLQQVQRENAAAVREQERQRGWGLGAVL